MLPASITQRQCMISTGILLKLGGYWLLHVNIILIIGILLKLGGYWLIHVYIILIFETWSKLGGYEVLSRLYYWELVPIKVLFNCLLEL